MLRVKLEECLLDISDLEVGGAPDADIGPYEHGRQHTFRSPTAATMHSDHTRGRGLDKSGKYEADTTARYDLDSSEL